MLRSAALIIGFQCVFVAAASGYQELARPASVRFRGAFGGIQSNMVSLLAEPEVRKELDLSEEQSQHVEEVITRLGESQKQLTKPSRLNQQDREAARSKFSTAMSDAERDFRKMLRPDQLARAEQLFLQLDGAVVVLKGDIAEALRLTDEQKKKIREIKLSGPSSPGRLRIMSKEERSKALAQWQATKKKLEDEMLAVLSDDQKRKFAEFTGEEFTFPHPEFED